MGRNAQRGTAVLAATVTAITGLVAGTGATGASAAPRACPQTWKVAQVQETPGAGGLADVVATGRKSAWAVGSAAMVGEIQPIVRRWDGERWNEAPAPDVPDTYLKVVDASSDQNVWASGDGYLEGPLRAVRWDGTGWTTTVVDQNAGIYDLDAVSANDVWAAVNGYVDSRPLRHWNGSGWTPADAPADVRALQMTSSTRGWAVGQNGKAPAVLRWDGANWTPMALPAYAPPNDGNVILNGVAELSPTDVWAVGLMRWQEEGAGMRYEPVALHWNGKRWTKVAVPATETGLEHVVPDGCGGVWMVRAPYTSLEHSVLRHRAGTWTEVGYPSVDPRLHTGMLGMANVPGTRKMLGVGEASRAVDPSDEVFFATG